MLRIKNQAYETKICRKDFLEKIKSVLNIDTTFVQYGNIYANADVVQHAENPPHGQAHLVFADTQANPSQNQKNLLFPIAD